METEKRNDKLRIIKKSPKTEIKIEMRKISARNLTYKENEMETDNGQLNFWMLIFFLGLAGIACLCAVLGAL